MPNNLPRLAVLLLLTLASSFSSGLYAQTPAAPTQQQIIDALTAPPMQMRSLRNLRVAPSQETAAVSTPAAVSEPNSPTTKPPTVQVETQEAEEAPSVSIPITFDFNSSTIRPENTQALTNLASALKSPALKAARFRVEGHTDAKGSAEYNLKLSSQRASSVKAWLIQRGVEPKRLESVGFGSTQLADSDAFSAANRRVRIVILQ